MRVCGTTAPGNGKYVVLVVSRAGCPQTRQVLGTALCSTFTMNPSTLRRLAVTPEIHHSLSAWQ